MQDIITMLKSREEEIANFITEANKEREHLISRLNDMDRQQASAERDMKRCRQARAALSQDDVDNEARVARAVDELMPAASPTAPYHPDRA